MITDEMEEAVAKAILDEGGAPGHSLHSWRCEHPDRYGECDCVKETAKVILEAVEPLILERIRQGVSVAASWQLDDPRTGYVDVQMDKALYDDLQKARKGDE